MGKLTRKPKASNPLSTPSRYERFNLSDNPFPSEPVVNKDSEDRRINGGIYETALRQREFEKIKANFLQQPQQDPNHLRLGYIMDESYIGRGNGKSAFLLNLEDVVNSEYCLDLSDGENKCFAVYVDPEPGGRTKSFNSFVDCLFRAILAGNLIRDSIAILRLNAIRELGDTPALVEAGDDEQLVECVSSQEWFTEVGIDLAAVASTVRRNSFLQDLPPSFPLFQETKGNSLFVSLVSQADFEAHYEQLKRGAERLTFVFSHLVRLFQAADFNGAYVLVDDFERIPDFQSARQKRDFALELRSVLFDGLYLNARVGFFNFLLVLHAGVPRLISEAWQESGMETRSPISQTSSRHVIKFEKLGRNHVGLLLKKYLDAYRITPDPTSTLAPFTDDAAERLGEVSEYNAARILKAAYGLLDRASELPEVSHINADFVDKYRDVDQDLAQKDEPGGISRAESTDLRRKAMGEDDR
jgi:hypothetical protein